MGVSGKLQAEVDIKSSGDVFHELFLFKPQNVSNIVPDQIHGCNLHEGEFGKLGSIIQWEYTLEGKKCIVKQLIEALDEEKKMARYPAIEGDILKEYKSITLSLHVITKGDIDAIMWELEYETFEDFGSYPTNVMDFLVAMTRKVEAHHLNA